MTENNHDNPGYTDENINNAARKKRRRKPNLNETEEPVANVDENDDANAVKREPRRRRRRERKLSEELNQTGTLGVSAYLEDLQDDIEMKVNSDDVNTYEIPTLSRGKPMVNQGTGDKVYVEGTRNFRVEDHNKYLKNQQKLSEKQAERLRIDQNESDNYLLQCSIGVTDRYRIFATFLHGLFAGMTLMHLVFCLVTSGATSITQQTFLTSYILLQQPYSIFNYVVFIIILISLWDRVDVGQPSSNFSPSQIGCLLALILTFIAFIIQNALYLYDKSFNDFRLDTSNLTKAAVLVNSFATWSIMDAVKSVLLCVSWLIIALVPTYDRFIEHLNESVDLSE